jgi:hypothetical protein
VIIEKMCLVQFLSSAALLPDLTFLTLKGSKLDQECLGDLAFVCLEEEALLAIQDFY